MTLGESTESTLLKTHRCTWVKPKLIFFISFQISIYEIKMIVQISYQVEDDEDRLSDVEETLEPKDDGVSKVTDEVFQFDVNCSNCNAPTKSKMKLVSILIEYIPEAHSGASELSFDGRVIGVRV